MRHYKAKDVLSPRRNLKDVVPIFQNNAFALAKVTWDGIQRVAIRWNVTQNELKNADKISGKVLCVGEPNSRGYPTWFILPDDFLESLINDSNLANEVRIILTDLRNQNEL